MAAASHQIKGSAAALCAVRRVVTFFSFGGGKGTTLQAAMIGRGWIGVNANPALGGGAALAFPTRNPSIGHSWTNHRPTPSGTVCACVSERL